MTSIAIHFTAKSNCGIPFFFCLNSPSINSHQKLRFDNGQHHVLLHSNRLNFLTIIRLGKGAMCLTGAAHQSIPPIKLQAEGRTPANRNSSCRFRCLLLTPVSGAQHCSTAQDQISELMSCLCNPSFPF